MRLSVDSQLSIKAVNLEIIMVNKQRTCSIINGCIKAVTVIVLNWFPSNTDNLIISGCIEAVVLVASNISIVHIYGSLKRNASHVECLVITLNPSLWLMMTSSSGNIFRVTGLLCWEFTDHRWIPLTKASDVKLWFFICCLNKRLCKPSRRWWFETPARSLWRHCNGKTIVLTVGHQKKVFAGASRGKLLF